MKEQRFPKGWDADRVKRLLKHYKSQSDVEAVAEDEAALAMPGQTMMVVPTELVPEIRKLLTKHRN